MTTEMWLAIAITIFFGILNLAISKYFNIRMHKIVESYKPTKNIDNMDTNTIMSLSFSSYRSVAVPCEGR